MSADATWTRRPERGSPGALHLMLWLYRRVMLGELIKESLKTIKDMGRREKLIFAPLVAAMIVLGVYPAFVLDVIGPSVAALIDHTQAALAAQAPVLAAN